MNGSTAQPALELPGDLFLRCLRPEQQREEKSRLRAVEHTRADEATREQVRLRAGEAVGVPVYLPAAGARGRRRNLRPRALRTPTDGWSKGGDRRPPKRQYTGLRDGLVSSPGGRRDGVRQ